MVLAQYPETIVLDTRVVRGAGGGPDKTILKSPQFLAAAGYKVICAYMHPRDDPGFEQLRERARAWSAPLIAVEDRGPWDWRVVSEMLGICRRERVSIWHGHDYKSNALGLILRRFWPLRLVTTVHGWVTKTRRTPLYYAIDRFCLSHYERVICVSEDLRGQCLTAGVPEDRCLVVENGVDTQEYSRTSGTAEAKLRVGLSPDRPVIGAVGRLEAEKGFDRLIRAADRLLRDGIDFDLVIVGEGSEGPELSRLVSGLGRQDRFHLLGFQSETIPIYEAMDVFALSSLREGLPNVLLEAMALGVAVVATQVGGVPRLIRDGENGLLVKTRSEEDLAQVLARVLTDSELRSRLGREGRSTVQARYGFEARMAKIRVIYDDLLGRRNPEPSLRYGVN